MKLINSHFVERVVLHRLDIEASLHHRCYIEEKVFYSDTSEDSFGTDTDLTKNVSSISFSRYDVLFLIISVWSLPCRDAIKKEGERYFC